MVGNLFRKEGKSPEAKNVHNPSRGRRRGRKEEDAKL